MLLDVKDEVFGCVNIRVDSPDGRVFVTIMEDSMRQPFKILVNIGKSGSSLAAWANCVADLVSISLTTVGLDKTIATLIGFKSDKAAHNSSTNGITLVQSGPEAIAHALVRYRINKYERMLRGWGVDPNGDDEDFFRPANSA